MAELPEGAEGDEGEVEVRGKGRERRGFRGEERQKTGSRKQELQGGRVQGSGFRVSGAATAWKQEAGSR
jgi:hypothetical protein